MLLQIVDLVEEAVEHISHRDEVFALPPLRDREHGALGGIEGILGVDSLAEADIDDLGAGVDETAQRRGALDDASVVLDVDGGGDGVEQTGEIRETACLVVLTASLQLVGEGDEVSRLAPVIKVENRAIDETVGDGVEVFRPQECRHPDDGVPVDEETAEHRLLRLHIVRRQSFDDAWYSGDHGSPRPCDGSANTTAGSPAGRRTKRDATGSRLMPSRPVLAGRDGVISSLRLADRVELFFDL